MIMLIQHIKPGSCAPQRPATHPHSARVQALALEQACKIPCGVEANKNMKSAYELAMEKLSKAAPTVTLSAEQKAELAELDSKCAAKIAERELLLRGEISKATERGEVEAVEQLEKQLVSDRKSL